MNAEVDGKRVNSWPVAQLGRAPDCGSGNAGSIPVGQPRRQL